VTGHQLEAATEEDVVLLQPGAVGHSVAALGVAVVWAALAAGRFGDEGLTWTSGLTSGAAALWALTWVRGPHQTVVATAAGHLRIRPRWRRRVLQRDEIVDVRVAPKGWKQGHALDVVRRDGRVQRLPQTARSVEEASEQKRRLLRWLAAGG